MKDSSEKTRAVFLETAVGLETDGIMMVALNKDWIL